MRHREREESKKLRETKTDREEQRPRVKDRAKEAQRSTEAHLELHWENASVKHVLLQIETFERLKETTPTDTKKHR